MSNFIRVKQVAKMLDMGESTVWLWVKEEKFPKPIKLSERVTVWDVKIIEEWVLNKSRVKAQ